MHLRAEIKAKAKAILLGKTTAGEKVDAGRFVPFGDEDIPFIAIYTGIELSERYDTVSEKRTLDLYIEAVTNGKDAESKMDILTNQIEHEMVQDETMGQLVHEVVLEKTEPGYDEESRSNIQGVKMTYKVTYFVEAVADCPVDKFERAYMETEDGSLKGDIVLDQ